MYLTFCIGRFRRPQFCARDSESGFHVSDVIILSCSSQICYTIIYIMLSCVYFTPLTWLKLS